MLSAAADHVAAFVLLPQSVDRTRIECLLLFHPSAVADPAFDPSDAGDLWDLVNQQDWAICESVQRGMSSRSYTHGWFAPMEDDSADIRRWLLPRLGERGTDGREHFDHVVVGLGALGSATAYQLAKRGRSVLGLERFELGHRRGASHDTSRILRHSYHTPEYVRLTQDAYDDWARLSADAGRELVTVVGGLDLFPPDPAIPMVDYTAALTEVGIDYELLDVDAIGERWPQFALPAGTVGLYQERGAIVPAGPGTAAMQDLARQHGAVLRDHARGRGGDGHVGHAGRRHDVLLRQRGALRRRVDEPAARAARSRRSR